MDNSVTQENPGQCSPSTRASNAVLPHPMHSLYVPCAMGCLSCPPLDTPQNSCHLTPVWGMLCIHSCLPMCAHCPYTPSASAQATLPCRPTPAALHASCTGHTPHMHGLQLPHHPEMWGRLHSCMKCSEHVWCPPSLCPVLPPSSLLSCPPTLIAASCPLMCLPSSAPGYELLSRWRRLLPTPQLGAITMLCLSLNPCSGEHGRWTGP